MSKGQPLECFGVIWAHNDAYACLKALIKDEDIFLKLLCDDLKSMISEQVILFKYKNDFKWSTNNTEIIDCDHPYYQIFYTITEVEVKQW